MRIARWMIGMAVCASVMLPIFCAGCKSKAAESDVEAGQSLSEGMPAEAKAAREAAMMNAKGKAGVQNQGAKGGQ